MRERTAEWHEKYTLPTLWEFYKPNRLDHGSYFYDWTSWDEVAWRKFYQVWMSFLNDYKNAGGRVTVSDDAAFIYNLYGFGVIEEMELLQEAGFHPLEVLRSATFQGAQVLGMDGRIGSIRPGKLADLVITEYNPLQNFKGLYGTGHFKLGDDNQPERVGGVKYTIKDGIVYDARELLGDVKKIVSEARQTQAEAN